MPGGRADDAGSGPCGSLYCIDVMNPDVFVIGGGVSRAGEYLTEGIRRYYQQYAFHASAETPFVLASLGNDAGDDRCSRHGLQFLE